MSPQVANVPVTVWYIVEPGADRVFVSTSPPTSYVLKPGAAIYRSTVELPIEVAATEVPIRALAHLESKNDPGTPIALTDGLPAAVADTIRALELEGIKVELLRVRLAGPPEEGRLASTSVPSGRLIPLPADQAPDPWGGTTTEG